MTFSTVQSDYRVMSFVSHFGHTFWSTEGVVLYFQVSFFFYICWTSSVEICRTSVYWLLIVQMCLLWTCFQCQTLTHFRPCFNAAYIVFVGPCFMYRNSYVWRNAEWSADVSKMVRALDTKKVSFCMEQKCPEFLKGSLQNVCIEQIIQFIHTCTIFSYFSSQLLSVLLLITTTFTSS